MAPPAWPMYMPSYMPRPPTQQAFMLEELARQGQDLEAHELKVQHMARTCNLDDVRDAGVVTAASVLGSRCFVSRNRHPDMIVPRLHLRDPRPLQMLNLQGSRLVLVLLRL